MVTRKFFKSYCHDISVKELHDHFNFDVIGDVNKKIKEVATLKNATSDSLTFLNNMKYKDDFKVTRAAVCVVKDNAIAAAPPSITLLVCQDPYLLYAQIANFLYQKDSHNPHISSAAFISSTANIGINCHIETGAVIKDNVVVGDNCYIGANSYIAENVIIGNDCVISSNVVVQYAILGDKVILHPGVKIGQDGFGYAGTILIKVPQLGGVNIGNSVEIGANSCVDRGAIEDTVIGDNTKLDNLVQIGHNATIGKNCVIVAQVGIAGSANIEDGVMIGGQVGVAGHINIGSNTKIAAKSAVLSNVGINKVIGGIPAVDIMIWHRMMLFLKKAIRKKK